MAHPRSVTARAARVLGVALPLALLVASDPSRADDDPGVIPMQVVLGETASLGVGPVRNLICDDPSLVRPVDTSSGPGLLALRLGKTLCSVTDAVSMRRVYRVEVVPPGGARAPSGPGGS